MHIVITADSSDDGEVSVSVYRFDAAEDANKFAGRLAGAAQATAEGWGGYPAAVLTLDAESSDGFDDPDEMLAEWDDEGPEVDED